MHQRKSKKLLIYFFLLILFGSITNIKLTNLNFEKTININVSGLSNFENSNIRDKINDLKFKNIFFLNTIEITNLINSDSLVESFVVFKKYPSTLDIEIVKTNFLARTNYNGKSLLIGSNGKFSEDRFLYDKLPFIYGKIEIKEFLEFKKIIDLSKLPYDQIKKFYFFPSKRWDLKLKNNVLLKLSSKDPETALDNALKILQNEDLKNIKTLDARINNQIILNE